jgi:hypothetical protein
MIYEVKLKRSRNFTGNGFTVIIMDDYEADDVLGS